MNPRSQAVTAVQRELSRRRFLQLSSTLALAAAVGPVFGDTAAPTRRYDVCVYGGTSGGVMAAVTLGRLGRSVLLVEPTRHVGGMTSGGLGWVDYGQAKAIGGATKQYFESVRDYYAAQNLKSNGWSVEPHVAELLFEKLLAHKSIEVVREMRLSSVTKSGRQLQSITLDHAPVLPHGAPAPTPNEKQALVVVAAMFLDCSYEGDLLAAAGVSHRTDREGREEFGESLAGLCYAIPTSDRDDLSVNRADPAVRSVPLKIDPFVRPGDPSSGLLPLVSAAPVETSGRASTITQAYNFRLCLTKEQAMPIAAPANYDPAKYELFHRYFTALHQVGKPLWAGDLYFNFGHERRYSMPRLLKITRLLKGKTDVNNATGISTDFVTGGAERYARADWAERSRIWQAHEDYQRGLFFFLRTNERLPAWLPSEMAPWGLARDEFQDTGGWPYQLYIREARRMVGRYVIDQAHCERALPRKDSIGQGSYALDSHICQRQVKDGAVIHEGGFYARDVEKPYPIPYAAITPKAEECENLLVTFCVSATHVAFASVRMEPPFMIMSESAAHAIDLALKEGKSVQEIDLAQLHDRLVKAGQLL